MMDVINGAALISIAVVSVECRAEMSAPAVAVGLRQ